MIRPLDRAEVLLWQWEQPSTRLVGDLDRENHPGGDLHAIQFRTWAVTDRVWAARYWARQKNEGDAA